VDFKASKILYGDSMGGAIDEDIEEILTWWTYHHTGVTFTKSYLPITRQRDGFSCGLLAWNALAAYLLPNIHSLINASDVAKGRLEMFLRVIEQHNEVSRVFRRISHSKIYWLVLSNYDRRIFRYLRRRYGH
jgi:hypothetical protein